jgi:UDP-N-acetylglucosamine/UDP-N-acetylgalactosamine diphosphorylase
VPFLETVTTGSTRLAYHVARKKVAHWDPATGQTVTPNTENALKFETFVFDALPLADRWLAVSVRRDDEFAPLKNATGADSPETVRALTLARNARWLEAVGIETEHPVEIPPLVALDAADLVGKIPPGFRPTGPTVL